MSVEIKSKELVLIPTNQVKPNPKNQNKHSKEQIDRLSKIIEYQGFRSPLIISNQSGLLVSGHGRLLAAKTIGLESVPVIFQDFADETQETAAMISENSIASWSELDLSMVNLQLGDMGPDFDIDLLGIKQFSLDANFDPGTLDDQGRLDQKKPLITQCPNCGECFDANENKPKD